MLWILPINLPTLVVWIHNLTVQWLTPFSSHHNVLSILPFVLLVETLSTGKMIPRLHRHSHRQRSITASTAQGQQNADYHPKLHSLAHQATSVLFFAMAAYAAIYGVTYAYVLHHIVNVISAWLMIVYYASGTESGFKGIARLLSVNREGVDVKGVMKFGESKDEGSVVEREQKEVRRVDRGGKVEEKVP